MKVAFDISQTYSNPAGCGYYANLFYQKLQNFDEINVLGLKSFGGLFYDVEFNNNDFLSSSPTFINTSHSDCTKFWDEHSFNADNYKYLDSPDIIHSNNFFFPPTAEYCLNIFTLYDLSFYDNPSWTSEANWSICSKGVFEASYKADHIVTISEFSKERFLTLFPNFNEEKISLIYPTSRFENYKLKKSYKAPIGYESKNFFLSVGTLEPRKNHISILSSYLKFIKSYGDNPPKLIFVGGQGWLFDETLKFINENLLTQHVVFAGYVSDDDLFWLYNNCLLNIYFSIYEGFGMPVLEALSANALTITSNIEPFGELFGNAIIKPDISDQCKFLTDFMIQVVTKREQFDYLDEYKKKLGHKFDLDANCKKLVNLYHSLR